MDYYDEIEPYIPSTPSSLIKEPKDDVPFDQGNAVATAREIIAATVTELAGDTETDTYNRSRNQKESGIEDSTYSPLSRNFDSIWLSSPEHTPSRPGNIITYSKEGKTYLSTNGSEVDGSKKDDLDENWARFILPPPKFSDPYLDVSENQLESPSTANHRKQKDSSNIGNDEEVNTNTAGMHMKVRRDDDTTFSFEENELKTNFEQGGDRTKSHQGRSKHVEVAHKIRRRSRQRRERQILAETTCTDDEISTENYGAATALHSTSLQQRAHQAWKSRQRKNSSMRSKHDNDSRPNKGSHVSFGASNTIYRFEPNGPHQHQYRNEDKEDMSMDRSLNSEYTKTLESEVEDMIKDILFIGNPNKNKPGRRKYRYKPDVRRKMKKKGIGSTTRNTGARVAGNGRLDVLHETNAEIAEDVASSASDSTLDVKKKHHDAINDLRFSKSKKIPTSRSKHRSRRMNALDDKSSVGSTLSRVSSVDSNTVETFQSEKNTTDDPMNTILGLVEGGMSIMSSAIGYALENYTKNEDQGNSIDENKQIPSDYDIFKSCGISIGDRKMMAEADTQTMTGVTDMSSKKRFAGYTDNANSVIVSKKVFGPTDTEGNFDSTSDAEEYDKRLIIENKNEVNRHIMELERSSELSMLALFAARSVHKLQGVEYDESSVVIDMHKEVKICPVTLKLPLGIIFLENDGGCFVTKVSPDGSAALSRIVEVGDQLASINGISSIKMKVDDICDVVRNSSNPTEIKLIFLRYIGPFRPITDNLNLENKANEINTCHPTDDKSNSSRNMKAIKSENKKPTKKKANFRLFGRSKNNNTKIDEKGTRGKSNIK
uniref:PDZ domain-containing protein n=1 Tax=Pseudo-nitzschia australis TaxID=44445 RepID=A0A7S4AN01_9STRA